MCKYTIFTERFYERAREPDGAGTAAATSIDDIVHNDACV